MGGRACELARVLQRNLGVRTLVAARGSLCLLLFLSWSFLSPSLALAAPNSADIQQAQQTLNSLGFDVGSADGSMGPRTRTALRTFQRQYGLKANGQLDNATLETLRVRQSATATPVKNATSDNIAVPKPSEGGTGAIGGFAIIGFLIWLLTRAFRSKEMSSAHTFQARSDMRGQAEKPTAPIRIATKDTIIEAQLVCRGSGSGKLQKVQWVAADQSVSVAGRAVGGMVYVGSQLPRKDGYGSENCLIDPSLKVAGGASNDGMQMFRIGLPMPCWSRRRACPTSIGLLEAGRIQIYILAMYFSFSTASSGGLCWTNLALRPVRWSTKFEGCWEFTATIAPFGDTRRRC